MGYLLGVDCGGTITKAAIYDFNGNEIAISSRQTEMLIPRPGFTERNLDDFWKAAADAIREVIHKSGINPGQIKSVATTGYGNGIVLAGSDGKPVYNGIVSTDSRAKSYVHAWYKDGTFESIHPYTQNTIWSAQPVVLLAWFRDNMPEILEKTKWVFCIKDYLRFLLTGEIFAEVSDYSSTNAMNLHTREFDREVFRQMGLVQYLQMFPPLKESAEICGYVTPEAAQMTGLKQGTPVAGGLMDILACCISTGTIDDSKLCLVAGTWSISQYQSDNLIYDKELFMTTASCMPDRYLVMEGSPTSASNLDWYIRELVDKNGEFSKFSFESIYDYCDSMVAGIKPEDSNIAFLPFLYASNAGANAKACFMGIESWHKREHLLRAVYEGIAFSTRYHVDKLLKHHDKFAVSRMAGGPTKSNVKVQMFSDVLQIPIEIPCGKELGALGAAICAGVASGTFSSFKEAVDSMVKVSRTYFPDSEKGKIYNEKYEVYKGTLELAEKFGKK